jgi:hypothetical protein
MNWKSIQMLYPTMGIISNSRETFSCWKTGLKNYTLLLKKSGQYNDLLCYGILAEKWIVLAYKSGNLKRVLFNRIFSLHPTVYMKNLLIKPQNN